MFHHTVACSSAEVLNIKINMKVNEKVIIKKEYFFQLKMVILRLYKPIKI